MRPTSPRMQVPLTVVFTAFAGAVSVLPARAATDDWVARYQATYIHQQKDRFDAGYSGQNSLTTQQEQSYSFTATAFWGIALWNNAEIYINPEAAEGVPLSNLTGLGGFTNGEMARTSGSTLNLYRARTFLRQTWNFGTDSQSVAAGPNQVATNVSSDRLVLTLGNIAMLDVFDANRYTHDGRTQFMNWALITYGAYDFPADARGYTWAAVAELYANSWTLRLGRGLLPRVPNGLELDTRAFRHYGDQAEIERDFSWREQPGAIHVLAFHDRAIMARYVDALGAAAASGSVPDIDAVRTTEHDKVGVGVSWEQALTASIGVFGRAMWADGSTETEAYATIDRSVAIGAVVEGAAWRRGKDAIGLAWAQDGLSALNRRYLAQGGLDFFVGDGKLDYSPERIVEMYYNCNVLRALWITADLQYINNPAYNRDRGPVTVMALRAHTEF